MGVSTLETANLVAYKTGSSWKHGVVISLGPPLLISDTSSGNVEECDPNHVESLFKLTNKVNVPYSSVSHRLYMYRVNELAELRFYLSQRYKEHFYGTMISPYSIIQLEGSNNVERNKNPLISKLMLPETVLISRHQSPAPGSIEHFAYEMAFDTAQALKSCKFIVDGTVSTIRRGIEFMDAVVSQLFLTSLKHELGGRDRILYFEYVSLLLGSILCDSPFGMNRSLFEIRIQCRGEPYDLYMCTQAYVKNPGNEKKLQAQKERKLLIEKIEFKAVALFTNYWYNGMAESKLFTEVHALIHPAPDGYAEYGSKLIKEWFNAVVGLRRENVGPQKNREWSKSERRVLEATYRLDLPTFIGTTIENDPAIGVDTQQLSSYFKNISRFLTVLTFLEFSAEAQFSILKLVFAAGLFNYAGEEIVRIGVPSQADLDRAISTNNMGRVQYRRVYERIYVYLIGALMYSDAKLDLKFHGLDFVFTGEELLGDTDTKSSIVPFMETASALMVLPGLIFQMFTSSIQTYVDQILSKLNMYTTKHMQIITGEELSGGIDTKLPSREICIAIMPSYGPRVALAVGGKPPVPAGELASMQDPTKAMDIVSLNRLLSDYINVRVNDLKLFYFLHYNNKIMENEAAVPAGIEKFTNTVNDVFYNGFRSRYGLIAAISKACQIVQQLPITALFKSTESVFREFGNPVHVGNEAACRKHMVDGKADEISMITYVGKRFGLRTTPRVKEKINWDLIDDGAHQLFQHIQDVGSTQIHLKQICRCLHAAISYDMALAAVLLTSLLCSASNETGLRNQVMYRSIQTDGVCTMDLNHLIRDLCLLGLWEQQKCGGRGCAIDIGASHNSERGDVFKRDPGSPTQQDSDSLLRKMPSRGNSSWSQQNDKKVNTSMLAKKKIRPRVRNTSDRTLIADPQSTRPRKSRGSRAVESQQKTPSGEPDQHEVDYGTLESSSERGYTWDTEDTGELVLHVDKGGSEENILDREKFEPFVGDTRDLRLSRHDEIPGAKFKVPVKSLSSESLIGTTALGKAVPKEYLKASTESFTTSKRIRDAAAEDIEYADPHSTFLPDDTRKRCSFIERIGQPQYDVLVAQHSRMLDNVNNGLPAIHYVQRSFDVIDSYFKETLTELTASPNLQLRTMTVVQETTSIQNALDSACCTELLKYGCEGYSITLNFHSLICLFDCLVPSSLIERVNSCFTEVARHTDINMALAELNADRDVLEACRIHTIRILRDVVKLPPDAYAIGRTKIFLQCRYYLFLLGKAKTLVRRRSISTVDSFKNLMVAFTTRIRYKRTLYVITRIQARWRVRLVEKKLEHNRKIFFPILYGIIRAGKALTPYIEVHGRLVDMNNNLKRDIKPSYEAMVDSAVVCIQSWWRHILAYKKLMQLKEDSVKKPIADFIQTLLRTLVATTIVSGSAIGAKNAISHDNDDKEKTASAIKIQSWWKSISNVNVNRFKSQLRGFRAMVIPISRLAEKLDRIKAVQVRWKLAYGMKSTPEFIRSIQAYEETNKYINLLATRIQKAWRCYFVRSQFLHLRYSAEIAQTYLHAQLYRRRFVTAVQSAVKIQRWWKAYLLLRGLGSPQTLYVASRPRPLRIVPENVYVQTVNTVLAAINTPRQVGSYAKRTCIMEEIEELKQKKRAQENSNVCRAGLHTLLKEVSYSWTELLTSYMDINIRRYLTDMKENGVPRSNTAYLTCEPFVLDTIMSINYEYSKSYPFREGWCLPLSVFMIRYLISALARRVRLVREPECFVSELITESMKDEPSEEPSNDCSEVDLVTLETERYIEFDSTVKNIMHDTFTQKTSAIDNDFSIFDIRDISKGFENIYSEKEARGSHRNIYLEREAFEIRDLQIGNSFALILVGEPLRNFIGKATNITANILLRKLSTRLRRILGDKTCCIFGWGSNKYYQLTFEGPGLPIKADAFSGRRLGFLPYETYDHYETGARDVIYSRIGDAFSKKSYFEHGLFDETNGLHLIRIIHVMNDKEFILFRRIARADEEKRRKEQMAKRYETIAGMEHGCSHDSMHIECVSQDSSEEEEINPYYKRAVSRGSGRGVSASRYEYRHGAKMYHQFDEYVHRKSKLKRHHMVERVIDYTFRIVAVGAGDDFSVALTNDGKLFSWGSNRDGRCGQGPKYDTVPEPRLVPILNDSGTRVLKFSVGRRHVICLCEGGNVFIWGAYSSVHLASKEKRDTVWPTRIPLENLLSPQCATKLDIIRGRERLRFETELPGYAYTAVDVLKDPEIPHFGTELGMTSAYLDDSAVRNGNGKYPDENLEETIGIDPYATRTGVRQSRAIWESERKNIPDIATSVQRHDDKVRRISEQKLRRAQRRADHEVFIETLRADARKAAEEKYEKMLDEGISIDEMASRGIVSVQKVKKIDGTGSIVNVTINVENITIPPIDPDSEDVSELSDEDHEIAFWDDKIHGTSRSMNGFPVEPNKEKWRVTQDGIKIDKQELSVKKLDGGPHTVPELKPTSYKRDVFVFDWTGVTPEEREWLECVEMIRAAQWDVINVKTECYMNTVHIRCRTNDMLKDILLVWGKKSHGQLGFYCERSAASGIRRRKLSDEVYGCPTTAIPAREDKLDDLVGQDAAKYGWLPTFIWLGERFTLRDRNYKILEYSIGCDNVIAMATYRDELRIFFWGGFPVHRYNLVRMIRKMETVEIQPDGPENKHLFKRVEVAKKSDTDPATDPYCLVDNENTTHDNVVGVVAFSCPFMIEFPELKHCVIQHVHSRAKTFEIIITAYDSVMQRPVIYAVKEFIAREIDGKNRINIQKGPDDRINQSTVHFSVVGADIATFKHLDICPHVDYMYRTNRVKNTIPMSTENIVRCSGFNPTNLAVFNRKN